MSITLPADRLRAVTERILVAGGSQPAEAQAVADHLIEANLRGHDSHGVGMLPAYVRNLAAGTLRPNAAPEIVQQDAQFAVWDAGGGYGQVVARQAIDWAIGAARHHGIAVHGLRNAHHIGRVGTYGEIAAAAGFLSIHFVNGHSGTWPRVAPFRGKEGRFSTNPVCIAMPGTARTPAIILDFATSRIALGKVRVAYNEKRAVVEGALIDAAGRPSTDPAVIHESQGSVLPFGEHKGYGLALICELLAGAIVGAGTIQSGTPPAKGITNGMLTIVLDPTRLSAGPAIAAEVDGLVAWVKSAPPADPDAPVLIAGEPERIARAQRLRDGIVVDDTTWAQIREAASSLQVAIEAP